MLSTDLLFYAALGFAGQLVDGALGMAYGLIVTSALLATGAPPTIASASVHAAEVVTTGLAGTSHIWHKNVDWPMFKRLAPAGVAGGVVGAYLLTGLPEEWVKFFIALYLLAITVLVARRVLKKQPKKQPSKKVREKRIGTVPLGAAGGFFDAIGGGGWGPLVTSTLIARGDHPRESIGSVTLSEFFVTVAVSATFIYSLEWTEYAQIVLGLVIGGAVAAPLAGWLSRILRPRTLMIMVAIVVAVLAVFNIVRLFIA
jgi:uncharacterized membrane protein YfcA